MDLTYRFSLTAASLLVVDFVELAKIYQEANFDWNAINHNEVIRDRETTRKREFAELKLRLSYLSEEEIRFITGTHIDNQKIFTFLAAVRTYRVLREFVDFIVNEKLMVFNYQLSVGDMNSFMYQKRMENEVFDALSDTTFKKVQQVIFKMLEQAGLIDSVRSKKIQVPYLDYDMENMLSSMDKKYLLQL